VLDSLNMFDLTAALPEQVEEAMSVGRGLEGLPDGRDVAEVVVIGMGSSGIVADLLLATAAPFMPVPVVVVKSYECPAFVGERSLVFAISFSGETEETIQVATEAALQGARMVVISQGGELTRLAGGWGAPVIPVPLELTAARSALGAMALPPLVVLEDLGLFRGASHWILSAVDQLKRRRDELMDGGAGSVAAQIAERLAGTIPLIQGGGATGAAAAQRWKAQLNANAKVPAFWSVQPELSHNEVLGWVQLVDQTRRLFSVVSLRHDAEHPQVSRRFELAEELLNQVTRGVVEVRAEGEGELAQLLDLVLMGDFVSLWVAANAGVDPGPLDVLEELKKSLFGV
jgi:glucose/mannose-6-phosphate isomerase